MQLKCELYILMIFCPNWSNYTHFCTQFFKNVSRNNALILRFARYHRNAWKPHQLFYVAFNRLGHLNRHKQCDGPHSAWYITPSEVYLTFCDTQQYPVKDRVLWTELFYSYHKTFHKNKHILKDFVSDAKNGMHQQYYRKSVSYHFKNHELPDLIMLFCWKYYALN